MYLYMLTTIKTFVLIYRYCLYFLNVVLAKNLVGITLSNDKHGIVVHFHFTPNV